MELFEDIEYSARWLLFASFRYVSKLAYCVSPKSTNKANDINLVYRIRLKSIQCGKD